MTVKLAKFFSTSTPPPLPPPNGHSSSSSHSHSHSGNGNAGNYFNSTRVHPSPYDSVPPTMYAQHNASAAAYTPYHHHHHQHQHHQHHNNNDDDGHVDGDDGDGDEYDSLSLYSSQNGTSIMTSRDHPFNNSQRPLLAERKPIAAASSKTRSSSAKKCNASAAASIKSAPPPLSPLPPLPPPPQRSEYISPYVQAQKRDSAKGLHGFNNFDMLSQQYNAQLLHSPHIGYPYGSPPSPTANSQDFVFDALTLARPTKASWHDVLGLGNRLTSQPAQSAPPQPAAAAAASTPSTSTLASQSQSHFEDDFSATPSGPFVFGVPFEQQTNSSDVGVMQQQQQQPLLLPPPAVGRGFHDGHAVAEAAEAALQQQQQKQQFLSHSDASYNSHDSSTGSGSGISTKAATQSLLGKRKSKKNGKGHEIVAANTKKQTTTTTATTKTTRKTKPSTAAATTTTSSSQQQQQQLHSKPRIKCVVVGDGAVGKTNLILSYLGSAFNPEHVPTASDIYNADVMVNDSPVHLTLCDTAGQDTLDPLRELCYPECDVFILCFSIARPETFNAIRSKWAPKFTNAKAALILVGTQADLRTNGNVLHKLQLNGEKPIAYTEASNLAASIGAKYIETSSVTQDKVKEVFDTAIWEGLRPTTLPPTPRPPLWRRLCCLA